MSLLELPISNKQTSLYNNRLRRGYICILFSDKKILKKSKFLIIGSVKIFNLKSFALTKTERVCDNFVINQILNDHLNNNRTISCHH